jgi:hypothetical protein
VEIVAGIINEAAVKENTRAESESEDIDEHLFKSGEFLK